MNIKNVMSNMTDKLKERDDRICTYVIDKAKEKEDSNCETLSFFVIRNMGEVTPDMIYLNLSYHPRLDERNEFCLYLDGYKPIQFDSKYLERMMTQSFPEIKEKTIKKWSQTILEYCQEEYKDIIEIFQEEREAKKNEVSK